MSISIQLLLIAIGGAIGACGRFLATQWANQWVSSATAIPLGTLLVNVCGSALMGICYGLVVEKGMLPEGIRPFFMVGFLGAFTTFSTFSMDAFLLLEQGLWLNSGLYILANVVLSLLLFAVGLSIVRVLV